MINSPASLFDPVLPAQIIDLPLIEETKSFTGWILDARLSFCAILNVELHIYVWKFGGKRVSFKPLIACCQSHIEVF